MCPALTGSIFTDNSWSTLGLGWLGACIVLSGSPIAASALTLLDGGAIDQLMAFTMLTGSRLGAAFVVLVAGTVYALRHKGAGSRRAPISIGILSLLVTMVVYVPGAIVGFLLLERGVFDNLTIGTSPGLTSATDTLFGWSVDLLQEFLPGWALFPIGLVVLLAGFAMFDKVLPTIGSEELEHRDSAWYTRKWPMFLLGCGVCLLTLSVSVALTVLVPLVAKGYLRRRQHHPLHHGGEHHDARRHARRGDPARQPGGGAGGRGRHALGADLVAHPVDLLLPAAATGGAGRRSPHPPDARDGWWPSSPCCSPCRSCSSPSEPGRAT